MNDSSAPAHLAPAHQVQRGQKWAGQGADRFGPRRRHPARAGLVAVLGLATATLASVACTVVAMGAGAPPVGAQATTTTTASANCSAQLTSPPLVRTGWSASTNSKSSSTDAPANALDGNLATRFSTDEDQAPNLYFEVDMGSAQTFNELDMTVPNSANDYARGYDVEVWDGSGWTVVASCTGSSTPEIVSFPTQTARYVAVVLTASEAHWWWSIDEFYLFDASVVSQTNTTTTTSTTTTSTTAPTTTSTTVPTTVATTAPPTVPTTTTSTTTTSTTTTSTPTSSTTTVPSRHHRGHPRHPGWPGWWGHHHRGHPVPSRHRHHHR
jgi:hypothetical protein